MERQRWSSAFPMMSSLRHVTLGSNEIGDQGAVAIAAVLPQCRALVCLDVSYNKIGLAGAKALAAALPQCTQPEPAGALLF